MTMDGKRISSKDFLPKYPRRGKAKKMVAKKKTPPRLSKEESKDDSIPAFIGQRHNMAYWTCENPAYFGPIYTQAGIDPETKEMTFNQLPDQQCRHPWNPHTYLDGPDKDWEIPVTQCQMCGYKKDTSF